MTFPLLLLDSHAALSSTAYDLSIFLSSILTRGPLFPVLFSEPKRLPKSSGRKKTNNAHDDDNDDDDDDLQDARHNSGHANDDDNDNDSNGYSKSYRRTARRSRDAGGDNGNGPHVHVHFHGFDGTGDADGTAATDSEQARPSRAAKTSRRSMKHDADFPRASASPADPVARFRCVSACGKCRMHVPTQAVAHCLSPAAAHHSSVVALLSFYCQTADNVAPEPLSCTLRALPSVILRFFRTNVALFTVSVLGMAGVPHVLTMLLFVCVVRVRACACVCPFLPPVISVQPHPSDLEHALYGDNFPFTSPPPAMFTGDDAIIASTVRPFGMPGSHSRHSPRHLFTVGGATPSADLACLGTGLDMGDGGFGGFGSPLEPSLWAVMHDGCGGGYGAGGIPMPAGLVSADKAGHYYRVGRAGGMLATGACQRRRTGRGVWMGAGCWRDTQRHTKRRDSWPRKRWRRLR